MSCRRAVFAILAALAVAMPLNAQEERAQEAAAEDDPLEPFAELTGGATAYEGFFDLYQKGDRLWLAVPSDRLGQDFLMEMKIARGIGASGLFGGTMLDIFEGKVMTLEKHGDRVFLMQQPHRFTATSDPAAAQAVELTFGPSV
ncbi:MAG: DUF5118 domain-containing protein, partial [Gemmatimonadaceae bacterium]